MKTEKKEKLEKKMRTLRDAGLLFALIIAAGFMLGESVLPKQTASKKERTMAYQLFHHESAQFGAQPRPKPLFSQPTYDKQPKTFADSH